MPYLTFDEYSKMGFVLTSEQFEANEPYAERHLNRLTSDYYVFNSLEADTWTYRANKFKEAIAIQTEYVAENGKTIQETTSNNPKSIGVGRLSLSYADNSSTSATGSLVSSEVIDTLALTGLLYRGIDYR